MSPQDGFLVVAPTSAGGGAGGATSSSKKRKAAAAAADDGAPPPALTEYEAQRQQRIEHNRRIMQDLGLDTAAAAVKQSMKGNKRQKTSVQKKVWHNSQDNIAMLASCRTQ